MIIVSPFLFHLTGTAANEQMETDEKKDGPPCTHEIRFRRVGWVLIFPIQQFPDPTR